MPEVCVVCAGSLPRVRRVSCPWCNYSTCLGCQKRYLLSVEQGAPRCMCCSREWNRETLQRLLPRAFCDGPLRAHFAKLELERERAMLPSTQAFVEEEMSRRRAQERAQAIRREQEALREKLNLLQVQFLRELRAVRGSHHEEAERTEFRHKCPAEGCRGFVSTAWKCGLCEQYVCPDCNEVKGAARDGPHECAPGDVESMRAIRRECRECPGCGTQVSRVEGCNQMWCTRCHVPFDWRTGRAITRGVVHNPHMYEWQRTRGATTPQPPEHERGGGCGLPSLYALHGVLRESRATPVDSTTVLDLHQLLVHTEHVMLPAHDRGLVTPRETEEQNRDLRVRYMLSELSEKEWSDQLQRRRKAREKEQDLYQLLQMFLQVGTDLLRRWHDARTQPVEELISEFRALCEYHNLQATRLRSIYKCVTPVIAPVGNNFRWRRQRPS